MTDNDISKVISTTDVVKQVVITELLPSSSTSVMTSYIAIDAEGNKSPAEKGDILASPLLSATDVVKTYYVTYTYYNTYLVNGSTIVLRTNVSTTSDIVTEKLYIYPTKRVQLPQKTYTTKQAIPIQIESLVNSVNDEDDLNGGNLSNELYNEELRQTINVYATKTFMTTFTYFTTLLQGPNNSDNAAQASASVDAGNVDMSTVVNSHTRVIENVVTESIPMSFLPSTAVHRIKLLLFGDDERQPQMNGDKFTTMETLIGGQLLEITAVKSAVDPTSVHSHEDMQSVGVHKDENEQSETLIDIDNTKNDLENDQAAAGSELEVLETNPSSAEVEKRPALKNPVKIVKTTPSPVSNLIGSINFNNGLKVLRPMIDAVAGLINTNFRLNWNNDSVASNSQFVQHTSPLPVHIHPHRPSGKLPQIPDFIANYTGADHIPQPLPHIEPAKGHARNPIYIPVNSNKENFDAATTQQLIEQITSKNILPPEILDHAEIHANEISKLNVNSKNKIPLIDGGIPISPGEVITANSDIILGRPTGNRPRIPLNGNVHDKPTSAFDKAVSLSLIPSVTPPTGLLSPESFAGGDSHSISSIQSETYIGPPPPLPTQFKQKPQNVAKAQAHLNKIPIYRNKPIFLSNKAPAHIGSALPPHQVIANQIQINRIRAQQQQKPVEANRLVLQPHVIPIKHLVQEHIQPVQPVQHIPPHLPHQQKPLHAPTPNIGQSGNGNVHEYVINNVAGGLNDIIEIQRIPEVFSTDLPPVHIYNAPQEIVSYTAHTIEPSKIDLQRPHEIQTLNQLPEVVESATGQPLFVNIQPSQVAKVVIPHGSSSALIFGGVQEMHKSGEYFDDPSPYPKEDQVISIHARPAISSIKDAKTHSYDVNTLKSNVDSVYVKGYGPIVSNQKVNVDSHVQSQDVDMHPPPIVFKNQDTNNIPVTSGTYSSHDETTFNEVGNIDLHENDYLHPVSGHSSHHRHNGQHHGGHHTQYVQHHQQPQHPFHYEQVPQIQQIPPVRNLVNSDNHSPFKVDIQSINLGMQTEDNDSNDSNFSLEIDDQGPTEHSQAPSVNEHIIDQHKEDDCENEQGEVIQESNAAPQVVSSGQSYSDQVNLNQIVSYNKPTTKTVDKARIPFTQTEANSLWERYPSTTQVYGISQTNAPTTTTMNYTPFPSVITTNKQPVSNNRSPFKAPHNLSIPHVLPELVNDMYSQMRYHNQIPAVANISHHPNRPTNPEQYYNQQSIENRPAKYANAGTHHISLIPIQNLQPPPHYPAPVFDRYSLTPPHLHRPLHQSRRPIAHQKPFARVPIHFKPSQPTNYTSHIEPVVPSWNNKPFESAHGRPNALHSSTTIVPTIIPTKSPLTDQTPYSSHVVGAISTQKPFTKVNAQDDSDGKITYYTSNTSRPHVYDLSRGKPFVHHASQRPTSIFNIGRLPAINVKNISNDIKVVDVESTQEGSEIFDFKESMNPHNLASVTEVNAITTDIVPFGQKNVPQISSYERENTYPKTPATEMQPPPSQTTKYKVFVPKNHPSKASSSPYHQNVLFEEVKGMQPPPIPKPSTKQKPEFSHQNHQNHGFVIAPTKLHQYENPSTATLSHVSTSPSHYPSLPFVPMPSYKATTNKVITEGDTKDIDSYAETTMKTTKASTTTKTTQAAPSTYTYENDFISEIEDIIRKPYEFINRIKPTTKAEPTVIDTTLKTSPKTTPTTTTSSTEINLDEYVHFSIGSNSNRYSVKEESRTTERPLYVTESEKKVTLGVPSNGHMPQSPHFGDTVTSSHATTEKNDVNEFIQPFVKLPSSVIDIMPSIVASLNPDDAYLSQTPNVEPSIEIASTTEQLIDLIEPTTTTLTVTTTQTTIVQSHGHTSTLVLTLTKTEMSTIVNTVTQTVKPTQSSTHEPTIKPTIYTAPITMRKVSGFTSSIVPNPSFSIYANHFDSDDHDDSNTSDEEESFELDTAHILEQLISPTALPKATVDVKAKPRPNSTASDSIFVVMTDRKKLGTININDVLNSTMNKKDHGPLDDVSTDSDPDSDEFFDNLPKRDEDDITNDVSHVLLGGILIATPPRSSEVSNKNVPIKISVKNTNDHNSHFDVNRHEEVEEHLNHQSSVGIVEETRREETTAQVECQPDCKAVNNEVCQMKQPEDTPRCVCRPGFARMFPDRPCKRK